jgi:hypothetical protein
MKDLYGLRRVSSLCGDNVAAKILALSGRFHILFDRRKEKIPLLFDKLANGIIIGKELLK